jgi:hypothetical protein
MLSNIANAVLAFAKRNPAVVSYVVSLGVAALAHYGLKVDATQLTAILLALLTWTHAGFHAATRKVPASPKGEHEA